MPFHCLFILFLVLGCRAKPEDKPTKPTPPTTPQIIKSTDPPVETAQKIPSIRIEIIDRTTVDERPVDMATPLITLSEVAAHSAGFSTTDDGMLAGVETHYTILVDGKSQPKAENGLLTWGVQITIRIEDEYGLAEDITGYAKGRTPFVRAATPEIKTVFGHVLSAALKTAFRDVWMQLEYKNADLERAKAGLHTKEVAEKWAALRRLGEHGEKDTVPLIIEQLDGADPMTAHICIGVLGRIGGKDALEHLKKIIQEGNDEWAMSAIKTLWIMNAERTLPMIKKIQNSHPSKEVRAFAAEILAQPSDGQ